MKRNSHEQALARLKEQQRRLQERAGKIHARMRKQDRAVDTRRKILAGSLLLEWMERDPDMKRKTMTELDRYLGRNIDRQHFELRLHGDDNLKMVSSIDEKEEQKKVS